MGRRTIFFLDERAGGTKRKLIGARLSFLTRDNRVFIATWKFEKPCIVDRYEILNGQTGTI